MGWFSFSFLYNHFIHLEKRAVHTTYGIPFTLSLYLVMWLSFICTYMGQYYATT